MDAKYRVSFPVTGTEASSSLPVGIPHQWAHLERKSSLIPNPNLHNQPQKHAQIARRWSDLQSSSPPPAITAEHLGAPRRAGLMVHAFLRRGHPIASRRQVSPSSVSGPPTTEPPVAAGRWRPGMPSRRAQKGSPASSQAAGRTPGYFPKSKCYNPTNCGNTRIQVACPSLKKCYEFFSAQVSSPHPRRAAASLGSGRD